MSINNTIRTAGPFLGNGVNQAFPFTYKVFTRQDVLVAVTDADDNETLLTLDVDYTVTLNSDQDSNPGGVITTTTAPAAGTTLAATSNIELTQPLDLTNQGGFYPKAISNALDRMTIQIQQLATRVGLGLNVGASAQIGAVLSFIGTLAAASGASLVGWIQLGLAAVARTVQDKLRESVSVADFGASPAATAAVNTAAIQAAFDYVKRNGDGYLSSISGRVFFPNGVYKVNNTLFLYNGMFLDGESAGGVLLEQQDTTKTTLKNVDAVTGIDNTATIKRIVVSYIAQSATPGATGVDLGSTTAISPVMEDVTVYRAYVGFSFELTINLIMKRCYAVNATQEGFDFVSTEDGAHNSAAIIEGCYAAGCGRWGFGGTVIGSSLRGVAADRCETGFHMTLLNSSLQGSTEACDTRGAHILNSEGYDVHLYCVPKEGATDGIWLMDSPYGRIADTTIVWSGAGAGYSIRTSGTTENIVVLNSIIGRFGVDYYNDPKVITTIGGALVLGATVTPNPPITVGAIPEPGHGAISAAFSGGSGPAGADGTGGLRVAVEPGYGISMQAWDDTYPRWGFFRYGAEAPDCIFEGSYASAIAYWRSPIAIQSPDGAWHGLKVANDGTLSSYSVPSP